MEQICDGSDIIGFTSTKNKNVVNIKTMSSHDEIPVNFHGNKGTRRNLGIYMTTQDIFHEIGKKRREGVIYIKQ